MRITGETDAGPPAETLAPEERQATVDRLCEHFARDALTTSELELRLDLAYAARTRAELVSLEHDLPALKSETRLAPPPAEAPSSVPSDPGRAVPERDLIVSIWGGTERKGGWTPARRLTALTLMGGAELDFRQAVLTTREVSVRVIAVMGGVLVIVPPGVGVEWAGIALMGGVTTPERTGLARCRRSRSTDQRTRLHGRPTAFRHGSFWTGSDPRGRRQARGKRARPRARTGSSDRGVAPFYGRMPRSGGGAPADVPQLQDSQ